MIWICTPRLFSQATINIKLVYYNPTQSTPYPPLWVSIISAPKE